MTKETAIKLIEYIKRVKPEVWESVTKSPDSEHPEGGWPDYLVELEEKVPWIFEPIIKAMNEEEK